MRNTCCRRLPRITTWLTAASGAIAVAANPPAAPTTRQLIDQLAADLPSERAEAQEILSQMGDPAIEPLTAALDDPRPQVAMGSRTALRWINLMHRPGLDPAVLRITRQYLQTTSDQIKLQSLNQLTQISPSPQAALVRLLLLEPDESLRKEIVQRMGLNVRREIPRLLAEDDLPAVEAVLDARANFDPAEYAADYVAFEQLTGKSAGLIDKLRAESGNVPPEAREGIAITEAYFGRFTIVPGGPPTPVTIPENGPLRLMALASLSDQSRWDSFQYVVGGTALPGGVDFNQWGIEYCCHRLNLQPDALDDSLRGPDEILRQPAAMPVSAAQVHLLNDEPDVVGHIDAGPMTVFPLLVARGDYHAARQLADERGLDGAALRAIADEMNRDLGLVDAKKAPAAGESKRTPVERANADFKIRNYAAAEAEFAELARAEPSRPAYLYLEGKSAVLDGNATAGHRMMSHAELIPMGDPAWRFELVKALSDAGLTVEAAGQADFATRTGTWFDLDGFGLIDVYRWQGDQAAAAGRWRDAAERYDRAVLARQLIPSSDTTPADYLFLPAAAHLMHARDWWARGDRKKSLAELDRYRLYFPIETEPVIEFVKKLDTAGDRDEADKRFDAEWTLLTTICREFPKSPLLNQDLARLAAGCGRRTSAAIPYAEAAHRADPTAESRELIDGLRRAVDR